MFNLTVGAAHTFYVGTNGWLVHNVTRHPLLPTPPLLSTEGNVGTYDDLITAGTPYDGLTPHHMPSSGYMQANAKEPWTKAKGIAMDVYDPGAKWIGRHTQTTTYMKRLSRIPHYANLSPRDALAYDIREMRRIYQKEGLYNDKIRQGLQEVIRKNKADFPLTFAKSSGCLEGIR